MEYSKMTLGQYLKEQRELKGLSIDEAALETNIAKKYIEALEKDEYGFFPAEMYVTGFLSSYIEILELDKELVLSMYKRAINKESEVPLEAFYNLHNSNENLKKYSIWFLIGIPLILIIAILVFTFDKETEYMSNSNILYNNSIITNISLEELQNSENKIKTGDQHTIIITNEKEELINIELQGIKKNQIKFRIGQNQYIYKLGDILNIDINSNTISGLGIEILDLDNNKVELILNIIPKQEQYASFFDITPYKNAIRNTVQIIQLSNVNVFNAKITASRPVWVEYQADTVAAQSKILNSNESISFSFIDGVKLSLGNAGAATITFNEFTNVIRGGIAGETSQSIFYKKREQDIITLYRSQLK